MLSVLIAGVALLTAAGSEFRPLTDAELKALLPGSFVRAVVPPNLQDLSTPEQFNRDGSYIRYADNRELEGHYTVRDGKVCVKGEVHPEYCRFMAVDKAGRHYFAKPVLPVGRWWPVSIEHPR